MTSDIHLDALCDYANGRVSVADLDLDSYISTENMLQNKEGICQSSGLPTVAQAQAYQPNDVLISNIRPYFKKIWFADRSGGCSNDVLVLRAKDTCYPRFLYYLLSDDNFFTYATATGKGTKMPRGDKGAIMRYLVPDVPYDMQVEIADTLFALDARIAENKKINHHLEQMAQAIFKSWFVDFEPFGGVMPDDWRMGSFADITTSIYSGGTPNTRNKAYWNGNLPWLSSGETRNHFIISSEKSITEDGARNSSTRLAHRIDIVIASAGQGLTRGQTSLLLFDSYINQSVIVISSAHPLYVFLNLLGRYEELRAISDSSSIRGSLTTKMIAQLPTLIPVDTALQKFSLLIEPLISQIENNLRESDSLVATRNILLPRLMSGELSVSDYAAK